MNLSLVCAYCGHSYQDHWNVYEYGAEKPFGKECIHGLKLDKRRVEGKQCGCTLGRVDQISQPCRCVRENDLVHTEKCVYHGNEKN